MKAYQVFAGERRVYSCQKFSTLSDFLLDVAKDGQLSAVTVRHNPSAYEQVVYINNLEYAYGWCTAVAYGIPTDYGTFMSSRSTRKEGL